MAQERHKRNLVHILLCTNVCACFLFFVLCFTFARFSPAPVGLFSRSRLRGTQGVRLYTTTQVWVPGGLCGAYSGRSNPRNLASNHGVALRGARAEQDNGKPTCQLFCSTAVALYFVAATIQEQPHIKFVWTTTMRVWTLHIGVCCVQ